MANIISLFKRKRDDKDHFKTIVGPHIEALYYSAYHLTQSQSDAEDLVQELLVHLTKHLETMARVENLRPWLLKSLYNRFVDTHRKHQRSPIQQATTVALSTVDDANDEMTKIAFDHSDDFKQLDDRQALQQALESLDENQRHTILLHDVEGYTATEVAEILDINIGTVKSRLHRGREKLKKLLALGTF